MNPNFSKKTKWLILISFSVLIGVNQLLWLTFAPIIISTQDFFKVSEFEANLLTLIFPIIYVIFSFHSGKLIDKKGYKKIVTFAGLLMLLGSSIRFFSFQNYWLVFSGQALIAISQPYMLNAINKITADWFETKNIQTATGIIIGILFLGTLVGAFIPAPLIEAFGFKGMLLVNVIIALVAIGFFMLVIKEKRTSLAAEALSFSTIFNLLKNKQLWTIAVLIFISFGYFNGITNWIAPILEPKGINEIEAGIITAIFILGGIFGAFLIPLLSDKFGKRQIFIIVAIFSGLILTYPLFNAPSFNWLIFLAFILGFTLLAGYPILIAITEQISEHKDAAKAVSFLQLMGNLGGVLVVLTMEVIKNLTGAWSSATLVLTAIMLIALPFTFALKDKLD